jgi:hypothetical protein
MKVKPSELYIDQALTTVVGYLIHSIVIAIFHVQTLTSIFSKQYFHVHPYVYTKCHISGMQHTYTINLVAKFFQKTQPYHGVLTVSYFDHNVTKVLFHVIQPI